MIITVRAIYESSSIFAGSTTGEYGDVNATGTDARFFGPQRITIDSNGNLYGGNDKIRKITFTRDTEGNVTTTSVSTLASFPSPSSIAIDSSGNFYVTSEKNNNIGKIVIITSP